ncbi:MAG: hypothetical protein KGN02_12625 [bacterium]|nr:hypothetical protein [bacterium]
MKTLLLALLVALAAAPLAASAQDRCTQETLDVRGTPVAVSYCVEGAAASAPGEQALTVAATYAGGGHSIEQTSTMKFVAGEGPSRVIESVNLGGLGLTGTLHLTLVYTGGTVHVESAILTPGAIIVK